MLRPESIIDDPNNGETEVPLMAFDGNKMVKLRQKIHVTAVQSCQSVRGFERLAVMAYGKLLVQVGAGRDTPGCIVLRIEAGKYTLLWNAKGVFSAIEQANDDDNDDEEYSASPQASVQRLLRDHAEHVVAASGDGIPECDFEWWKGFLVWDCPTIACGVVPLSFFPERQGGAMQKLTNKPLKQCVNDLKECVAVKLSTHTQLSFVYDIVGAGAPLTRLHYVLDAGRRPLTQTTRFFETYGVHRTLFFKRFEARVSRPQNWWVVYE